MDTNKLRIQVNQTVKGIAIDHPLGTVGKVVLALDPLEPMSEEIFPKDPPLRAPTGVESCYGDLGFI